MTTPSETEQRLIAVEQALVESGGKLSATELACRLRVSQSTIKRDIAAIRQRWARSQEDRDAERVLTAAIYQAVAEAAWQQFTRLTEEAPASQAVTRYLRLILDAHAMRARLLGLDVPILSEADIAYERTITVQYFDDLGHPTDPPPWAWPSRDAASDPE